MTDTIPSVVTVDPNFLPDWAEAMLVTIQGGAELLFVYKDAARKVTSKFVRAQDVSRAYAKIKYDTGEIPAGIARMGFGPHGMWAIYRQPAKVVSMIFLDDRPILAPIPATVMLGVDRKYWIFSERRGKFYHAPFDNVYKSGKICWGTNKLPSVTDGSSMIDAWKLFFQTPFTHRNDGNGSYREMYRALKGTKKFTGKLSPINATLNSLVRLANREGEEEDL